MKKYILIAFLILAPFLSPSLSAQTISPIAQQVGKKFSGSFLVKNDTLGPISVTIETYSATFNEKGIVWSPLDPKVHVTLSETSFRLGPQATEEIMFKGKTEGTEPVSFSFLAEFTLGHVATTSKSNIMQVRMILPETIYSCSKRVDHCRETMLDQAHLTAQK